MTRIFFFLISLPALAQTVRVPKAQDLIDQLLREHAEIQTIGLHVTLPGQTENVNIACSKPGKVGKRSAPIDMEVIATGKPSLRMASKGAFDIGVPIGDRNGHKVGMIVVVIPAARAKDADDAMRQVLAIRDVLQSRIASLDDLFVGADVVNSPLVMIGQTPLPEVKGEFTRLAVDVAANRLYAVARANQSVEVFDLLGEHLTSSPTGTAETVVTSNNGQTVKDLKNHCRFEAVAGGKVEVREERTGKLLATLDGLGEVGDLNFDEAGHRLIVTGSNGVFVFKQLDTRQYRQICRFDSMGGRRSLYVPEQKLLYVIHGKNRQDGAALQVYQLKD